MCISLFLDNDADSINQHKFSSMKEHTFIISQFWKSWIQAGIAGSQGLTRCQQDHSHRGKLQGRNWSQPPQALEQKCPFSCYLRAGDHPPPPEPVHIPWSVVGPFFHFKDSNNESSHHTSNVSESLMSLIFPLLSTPSELWLTLPFLRSQLIIQGWPGSSWLIFCFKFTWLETLIPSAKSFYMGAWISF